jgi:hypothetical protein
MKQSIVQKKTLNSYRGVLRNFFSYTRDRTYDRKHEFTDDDYESVTHQQVVDWFNFRCFGTINPVRDDNDNLIAQMRANSIKYNKKALLYYMTLEPRTSDDVNRLVRLVNQLQVRKQGQPSQARKACKHAAFQHLIHVLKDEKTRRKHSGRNTNGRGEHIFSIGIPAFLCFQFAMIGRCDDVSKFFIENLQCHENFPTYALQARFSWSKNCYEEELCPWQILLGSVMTIYCVLVNTGLWCETQLGKTPGAYQSPYVFSFSSDNTIPSGALKTNAFVQKTVTNIFKTDYFAGQKLGSHSIRKFATTHSRNSGVSKDDTDYRGRWKDGRRVSSNYEDPMLPYVDIKVCMAMCQGGPCTYVAKADCITQEFLCTNVVPHIANKLGANVAIVLGSAVMWAVFSDPTMVPTFLREQVMRAYDALPNKLPDGENPIARRKLFLTGGVNAFRLAEVPEHAQVHSEDGGLFGEVGTALRDFMTVTTSQLTEVRQGQ